MQEEDLQMQMADVEGLAEAFAPSVIILPQLSPLESSTRGMKQAAYALCASYRAILHRVTMILLMISAATRLKEMYYFLVLPPPKFIVYLLSHCILI